MRQFSQKRFIESAANYGIGAGSVLAQGRNNLDLRKDSRITIRAAAPR